MIELRAGESACPSYIREFTDCPRRALRCALTQQGASQSLSDILIPQIRVRRNELAHEPDALIMLSHVDRDPGRAQTVFGTKKRLVLSYHYAPDPIE